LLNRGREHTDDDDDGLEEEKVPHLSRRDHEKRELDTPEDLERKETKRATEVRRAESLLAENRLKQEAKRKLTK